MIYRHFCALAAVILAAGLSFLITKWPQGKNKTFSQHAAVYRHTIWYYIALFGITLPLVVLFFSKWFVPTFDLSRWFMDFIVASCIAQFMCTLIPELAGWREKLHRILAGISAVTLLPPLYMLTISRPPSDWLRYVVALCMAIMWIILVVSARNARHIGWRAQAGYFTAFFAAVLAVTYLG